MVLRSFQRTNVTQTQSNVNTVVKEIANSSIIDGVLIEDVELASGTSTKIAHKLGRTLQGWIIVGRNAAQHVYDENSGQTDLSTYLHLTAGGTVTVNVWVF